VKPADDVAAAQSQGAGARVRPGARRAAAGADGALAGRPGADGQRVGLADDDPRRRAADGAGVDHGCAIVSAHRTPERLADVGRRAAERGVQVIVAGAGGAAHLPGMLAAHTRLPVLGVPIESRALSGLDSLLSIVQMPRGVPVGTLAIGAAGAANAALLAAAVLALHDPNWRRGSTPTAPSGRPWPLAEPLPTERRFEP
jgi:phosphoribosylaminoimidazole carboxylase PurE protein